MRAAATPWRGACRLAGLAALVGLAALALGAGCDEAVAPEPPKSGNLPPESFLSVQSDSVAPLFYKVPLHWLGSDADGHVTGFRYRWTCLEAGGQPCGDPLPGWTETTATADTFLLYVPEPTRKYAFDLVAVDDDGVADPTPAHQVFTFYNTPPTVDFQPSSKPTQTLPAVTFYFQGVDPDSTDDPADHDTQTDLASLRAWLDGNEAGAHVVPYAEGAVTFAPADFQGRYGTRTVFVQVLDDGGAVSPPQQHSWQVVEPPARGILLVDDCRMGGFLEAFSDSSYRRVLRASAPDRYVVLDVEQIPRLSTTDLEATLSLFDRVVWYTDSDTLSSGALELARGGLDALLARAGHWFLCSGLAFGTHGAFGDQEAHFRDLFGIETVFTAPGGSTNFSISLEDSVQAAVQPGLEQFRFLSFGLRAIMECFGSRQEAATRSLYFYPPGEFVRTTEDSLQPFVNATQFDIGVEHQITNGGASVYVSFPIGVPINDTTLGENEIEIREMLRQIGILDP